MTAPPTPTELKELWVNSRLLLSVWAQHKEHPHCPIYRAQLDKHMEKLRAACTRAEAALENDDSAPE